MKTLTLTLSLALLLTSTACDPKDQCVADCDSNGATDPSGTATESATETSSATETETTGASAECQDHTDEATLFVEQNRACETLLDCVPADGICYNGPLSAPCGTLALSADADQEAWQAIASDLADSCECGAAACGPAIICSEAQQCAPVFGNGSFCPNVARDVQTFLAANRACESDDECILLESTCYVDECSAVAVNTATNAADWTRLDTTLAECGGDAEGGYCNYVGDCGPTVRCSDEGQCLAEF